MLAATWLALQKQGRVSHCTLTFNLIIGLQDITPKAFLYSYIIKSKLTEHVPNDNFIIRCIFDLNQVLLINLRNA